MTLLTALTACSPSSLIRTPPTPTISSSLPQTTQDQLRDYDLAVQAVQTQYVDGSVFGSGWQSAVSTYRDRITQGVDNAHFYDALDGLLGTLRDGDLVLLRPIAQVVPSATSASATAEVSGTFTGIGVQVALPEPNKDRILVLKVYPGSPAATAGLQTHDAIRKVDGQPVTYTDRNSVLSRVRGPAGSTVTLTVHTPGKADRDVKVTRAPVSAPSQTVVKRVPGTNLGYVQPDVTNPEAIEVDVAQGLRDLSSSQGLDGLVLDLRTVQTGNFPVTGLLELFVNGQVGTAYLRSGKNPIHVTGKNIAGSQDMPMVVLVSDQTQGEAEAFAGILQDLGRAKLVGNRTPGKTPILLPVTLTNTGAQLQVPAGDIRGVKNQSWYRRGIQPDVTSDQAWETYTDQDDPVLKLAVQALTR